MGWFGWGYLKMNILLDWGSKVARSFASPGLNHDKNLVGPFEVQYALIERDLSVIDIGGVTTRGEPSVKFDREQGAF
jgi:hypothetical protein